MHFSLFPICSLVFASASVYNMTPDRPAQVYIVMDGDMSSDEIFRVGNKTVTQLGALASAYEETGFPFEVGFVYSLTTDPTACSFRFALEGDSTKYLQRIEDIIATHTADHSAAETRHRTSNAIWRTVRTGFEAHDDDTIRRVVVFLSDRLEDFGEGDETIPYCERNVVVSAETFASALEASRTGLLYSLVGPSSSTLQKQGNKLYKTDAGLSDLFVDEAASTNYSFDTIEYHLRRMLSSGWISSTSTTTAATTTTLPSTTTRPTTTTLPSTTTRLKTTKAPTTTTLSTSEVSSIDTIIAGCQNQMASSLPEWKEDCAEKCEFYATSPGTAWCGVPSTVDDLVECVLKYNSDHCSRATSRSASPSLRKRSLKVFAI